MITLGTGTHVCVDGVWHWIEVQIVFSITTTGTFKVYVDGVLDINVTATQTWTSGATNPGSFALYNMGTGTGGSANQSVLYDDVIFWDNTGSFFNTFPIGPRRIACLNPNGAGASTQFTPSTGANYSCVSQAYSGSANVSDTTSGKVDLYTTAGLTYTPLSAINAVVVNMFGSNPAGDGTKSLIAKLRSGATPSVASGATRTPTASNTNWQDVFYQDAAAVNWTATTVNAAQPGIGD